MQRDRLGLVPVLPCPESGFTIRTLVSPTVLAGANGLRWGADGALYVAQAFGSQVSAVDVADGTARIVSAADGPIVAPDDLAFDSHGNLFVTEVMAARVSAIRPGGTVDVIAADVPVANGVTVHGDRIFMSEFRPGGRILELFADGSTPRLVADDLMMPNALCLGPDGWLYFPLVPLGEVWRVGTAGGPAERVAGGFDVPTAVKFNAAGHLHVNESGNGAVTRVDLSSGTRETAAQVAFGTDNLAFAPDGRMFVSHYTNGEVTEFSRDGSSRIVAKGGMTGPFGLSAAPGGGLVAADGMSLAWIDAGGRIERPATLLQHGFPGYVRGVATDGAAAIVTNSAGQCARYLPGEEAMVLLDGLDEAMGLAREADGAVLICEAGAGKIVRIAPDGAVSIVVSGLARPTGIACAPDGGCFVSEAESGRVVHVRNGDVSVVMSGLVEPHGVAVLDSHAVVLDRGTGTLYRDGGGRDGSSLRVIASGLPSGTGRAMTPNTLPGIKDLMPGPLLPFADIAALGDGAIAVSGDRAGSIVVVEPG